MAEKIFKDFTEKQLSKVIELIFSNKKLEAIPVYAKLAKVDTQVAISDLGQLMDMLLTERNNDIKFLMEHAPRRCCINCIGRCGTYGIGSQPFITETGEYKGTRCDRFYSVADFKKTGVGRKVAMVIKNKKDTRIEKIYRIGDGISRITLMGYNSRTGEPEILSQKTFVANTDTICDHAIKDIRKFSSRSMNIYFYTDKISFSVGDVKPNPGESYAQYFNRANSQVREERNKILNEINSLDYLGALKYVMDILVQNPSMALVMKNYSSSEEFLRDYYPNKSVWEIAEEIRTQ